MTDLRTKVALVTGSARGIGRAVALRYAALGADVVINYSADAAGAATTVEEVERRGARARAVQADVSEVDDVERLFEEALDHFGGIDVVVANAGMEVVEQPLLQVTEADFDRLFAVNAKGSFFTLVRAGQHVADHGRIIYIGSSTSTTPLPGVGLYGASKTAPLYAVGVLALELAQRGVTVNAILPTAVDGAGVFTGMPADAPVRQQLEALRGGVRLGRPDDVADAAEYFASDLSAFVSGQQLLVSGGSAF